MAAAVLSAGCSGAAPSPEVTIYAAASLAPALDVVEAAYEEDHPNVSLVISTDSSAALRTQIEHGAPADLFLSADTGNAEALVEAGLTDGAAVPFATNRLAIVVPVDNPAGIDSPADLAADGVRIVGAGDQVPITRYAEALLERLASMPGYPPDFGDRYKASVVSREDNVQAVVTKVALGEGDAGIVYGTDALAAGGVTIIEIPAAASIEATYAAAVIAGDSTADARAFLDWLGGPDGRAILTDFGFGTPP